MIARQDLALFGIDVSRMNGLEIGPLDRPLVTRDMGKIAYVDRATRPELRDLYEGDPGVQVDEIVEVDFVHQGRLADVVGHERYDYVIASHAIEHVPDVVGWLMEVAEVLREGGLLSLVVPDKRYTFDFLRPISTGGQMVDAYLGGPRRPTFNQVLESLGMSVILDVNAAWSEDFDPSSLEFIHSEDVALERAVYAMGGGYVDTHCWVLTPQSLFDAFRLLIRLDLFEFKVTRFNPTAHGDLEFFVTLEKVSVNRADRATIRAQQIASIPLEPNLRQSRFGAGGIDGPQMPTDHCLPGAILDGDRGVALRAWANETKWWERVRLALPHRFGLLDRAMRDRW